MSTLGFWSFGGAKQRRLAAGYRRFGKPITAIFNIHCTPPVNKVRLCCKNQSVSNVYSNNLSSEIYT
jgi:hypothetical protein